MSFTHTVIDDSFHLQQQQPQNLQLKFYDSLVHKKRINIASKSMLMICLITKERLSRGLTLIQQSLCVGHCSKCFTGINSQSSLLLHEEGRDYAPGQTTEMGHRQD